MFGSLLEMFVCAMAGVPMPFVLFVRCWLANQKNTPAPLFRGPGLWYKVDMKSCARCASDLPEVSFYPGLGWCLGCASEVRREYLAAPSDPRPSRRNARCPGKFWLPETEESRWARIELNSLRRGARAAIWRRFLTEPQKYPPSRFQTPRLCCSRATTCS